MGDEEDYLNHGRDPKNKHIVKLPQGIWEHPCLSLFKLVSMDQFHRSKKVGDVKTFLDKQIGKRVFSIRGVISTNSFIEFPK